MQKIIIIPDSFKGTMSSQTVCRILREAALRHFPDADAIAAPVADGGEGSVDAFLAAVGGERVVIDVHGPYMQRVEAFYGILPGGTAVIEMAACAGLPLVGEDKHPELATTYGVGELMRDAIRRGCKKIIVGLGGSATNDLGAGAAAAMGACFCDDSGEEFLPTGGALGRIARIDDAAARDALRGVEVVAMCDVDNPLYGERGAAHIFGPQKGADAAMVALLDGQLRAAADTLKAAYGKDLAMIPGAGAAGGMGCGMMAFLGASLKMGIEVVLDTVGFDRMLEGADLVLTGEGRLDAQTLGGKVVAGVARRAKAAGVPVVAVVGGIGDGIAPIYGEGVSAVFSINKEPLDFSVAKLRSEENLALAADNILRLLRAFGV